MRSKAFTLIELLVVISILSVIGGVIGACLFGGIRVLDRAAAFSRKEASVQIAMLTVERDLVSINHFRGIPFKGSPAGFSFPSLLNAGSYDNGNKVTAQELGTIRYFYDARDKKIIRKAWPYPESPPAGRTADESVAANIARAEFEYYKKAEREGGEGNWVSSWSNPSNSPAGVRLIFAVMDNDAEEEYTKTVYLPVTGNQLEQVNQKKTAPGGKSAR